MKQSSNKTTPSFTEVYLPCDVQQTMQSFPAGPPKSFSKAENWHASTTLENGFSLLTAAR